jgi:hypothetical protein
MFLGYAENIGSAEGPRLSRSFARLAGRLALPTPSTGAPRILGQQPACPPRRITLSTMGGQASVVERGSPMPKPEMYPF